MVDDGSAPSISLPRGGGALHGLGEKFAADLHTGTGNISVPLPLLPGRNGFGPTLSLDYSTGQGNDAFGMGWALRVPEVSRKTARGVPRYDSSDVFILSGLEDLVPVSDAGANPELFRPRTEGLFALIERHRGPDDDHWEVRTQD